MRATHLRIPLLFLIVFLFFLFGCGPAVHKSRVMNVPPPVISENSKVPEQAEETNKVVLDPAPVVTNKQNNPMANIPETDSYSDANGGPQNVPPPPTTIQPVLDEALDFCQLAQDFWQKGELDQAIEALDQAYSLILNVNDTKENPKLIQQKEDLRFLISKRILEIYASRNIVVNGNHDEIPLVLNKHVQAEIALFTKSGEKGFFISSYKRSGRYREQIVSELKAAGLPEELSWLPLIESGFKVNALSKARALGLWQFIPSTGYKFGLKRDKYIDERLDPEKSTQSAISYLIELHKIFGDWSTVLAAYNCGEGRVLRVIRDQNINYLDNFWDLYERLPRETARYVPRFLATLHILNDPEKYGLKLPEVDKPLSYETLTVSKQVHLKNIAKAINVSEKALKELNPELRYNILPNDNYTLRLPLDKGTILLAAIDDLPISKPPSPAYVHHRVKTGETLSAIAKRYKTSVKKIMRANNLRRSNFIVAGKKLKIPLRGTVVYASATPTTLYHGKPSQYVVKRGDSLWIIAKRFQTTTKAIQNLNSLSGTTLKIGQVLKIPGSGDPKHAVKGSQAIYIVRQGDSPYEIAKTHNMPLSRFLSLNSLTPRCKIYPGQQVQVD